MIVIRFRRFLSTMVAVAAIAGAFAPSAVGAQGISRVDAARLSCNALQQIIQDRGAVIVRSRSLRSGNRLSDRYVSRRGFCYEGEVTRYGSVATADRDMCSVKLCVDNPYRRNNR